jgi:uncharacterized YccA/Bax inhibitor family protein
MMAQKANAAMTTSNPAFRAFRFEGDVGAQPMTVDGTARKTAILLLCSGGAAALTWHLYDSSPQSVQPLVWAGILVAFVVAIVTIMRPRVAPITAPIYAVFEGLALGAISGAINAHLPGIAEQAVLLTFGVLAGMLVAYQTGVIRVTEKFRLGVVSATAGIAVFYMIAFVSSLFGGSLGHTALVSNGFVGVGFSVFVVIIAALNLTLDFDQIARRASMGAPHYMEWYGAFTLMLTLVWLYLEILRLLSKLRSR